jgi:predicted metal-dependent phosphoesterase TrpH
MHTSLSDGACEVEELIELANNAKLSYMSITDHNHALAFQGENLPKLQSFKGHILTGCEIATSYKGNIIEILGYGIKPEKINSWYKEFFSEENLIKKENFLFDKLKKLCYKENIRLEEELNLGEIKKGCSKKTIYESLMKFDKNKEALRVNSYREFFRHVLSNPKHPLFLNEAETYPELKAAVNLIHAAGGKAFLAHPFEYGFENTLEAIEEITKLSPLDGIEVFHPSAAVDECCKLESFCKHHSLYISGGSDFHSFKRNTRVGLSSGNKTLNDELILPWIKENMLIK